MCALRSSSWSCWTHQAWHFFLLSVSILVGGNGNETDELHGAHVRVIDRITVKSKTRHNQV